MIADAELGVAAAGTSVQTVSSHGSNLHDVMEASSSVGLRQMLEGTWPGRWPKPAVRPVRQHRGAAPHNWVQQ